MRCGRQRTKVNGFLVVSLGLLVDCGEFQVCSGFSWGELI